MKTSILSPTQRLPCALVIDDDAAMCEVLRSYVEAQGFDVFVASSHAEAQEVLTKVELDIVLLDLVLQEESGLDLLKRIRIDSSSLPVIILTGYASVETAVKAMRFGASDFMTKPVDRTVLSMRIERAIELERARRLANTDGLTGLYNHRVFHARLAEEVTRAQRYGHPLSVLIADLDKFKHFNDSYGHPAGDEALIEVAKILKRSTRSSDIIARYGGEEFAAILPEASLEEARVFAERVRERIESTAFRHDSPVTDLTVSCGIAALRPDETHRDVVERADQALYRAKGSGRNAVSTAVA